MNVAGFNPRAGGPIPRISLIRGVILALVWLVLAIQTNAAVNLTFIAGTTNGRTNSEVVVPVRVQEFVDVGAFQFSLHWNPSIASFVAIEPQLGIPGLNTDDFGVFASAGTITVVWFDQETVGKTLPDETTAFSVRLRLTGPPASSDAVTIDGNPTQLLAGDSYGSIPVSAINGTLSIEHTLLVTCSTNKTAECGMAWNFDLPVVMDSCSGVPSIFNVLSTVTNVASCGFTATRTWEILDECDNRIVCAQTVSALDTTPPVVTCAPNKTVECGSAWTFDAPIAFDACSGNAITINIVSTATNVTVACAGIATRTWDILDSCGNRATCVQAVTIVDTTPPLLTCAPNKNVECGTAWNFDAPTATDNCSATNLVPQILSTVTNSTGNCGAIVTRTWEVYDGCNNRSACVQILTVVDTTKPVASCVGDKTMECGSAWTFDAPTGTDACTGDLVPNVVSTITNALGSCGYFATRIWEFVDPCNNRTTCQQQVTVIDTTPPVVTCVSNKTVQCGSGWSFDTPAAIDVCYGVVSPQIFSTATNMPGACGFVVTRTWEFLDGCSNRSTCAQSVTVVDTIPPVAICSPNKTVELGSNWNFDAPSGTDDCSPSVRIQIVGTVTNSGPCGASFTATRTWDVLDDCSNKVSCSQIVTVRDTTSPAITCAANKEINCLASWNFDAPTATDVASGIAPTISILSSVTNGSCDAGLTVTRTWRATDACGNSATCSQTVFGRAIVTLAGTIFSPTNYPPFLTDKRVATVTLTGSTNINANTAIDGSYQCTFDASSNVVVTPMLVQLGSPSDGIDALDILAVRKHILNAANLNSPYKILAADVDGDNSISAFDLLAMRRVVLGATNRFAKGLWRFVPSNYAFPNQLSPWGAPTNLTYSFAGSDLTGQDFVALKLGDVNYSWTPPGSSLGGVSKAKSLSGKGQSEPANATGNTVTFAIGSTNALSGTTVMVPVRVTSFTNVAAFQFTFRWDPAIVAFVDVPEAGFGLPYMSRSGTFNSANSNSGSLNVFWDDPAVAGVDLADGAAIFYVEFKIIGAPSDASTLMIDGSQTAFLVADSNIEPMPSAALSGRIAVEQPNRAPVVGTIIDTSINEETQLAFIATVSDPDGPGQTHTFSLDPGAPAGAVIDPATGAFTWTPAEAQGPGSYPITIRAMDNGLPPLSGTTTFTVMVIEVNAAPVANANSYMVNEDSILSVAAPGLLGNDSDPDGDLLIAILVQGPAHGALTLNANGSFNYTPAANFYGPDSFTYVANDGQVSSPVAMVSITVNTQNDAPVANSDGYSVNEDTLLAVPAPGVLGNDSDIDGDVLTALLVSGTSHGSITLSANGSFVYTPAANFNGTDSFTYRASDGPAESPPVIVTFTVNPVNDAPVANPDIYSVREDGVLVIAAPGVLGNDLDADGDMLSASVVTLPLHGGLSFSNNGAFTYTPVADFNGTDVFSYVVSDGIVTSAEVLVTLTVADTNDAPIANPDSFTMNEDSVLSVGGPGVLNNDIDPDGDTLTAILENQTIHGTLSLGGDGSFTYAPFANFHGVDSFTYRASDGQTNSKATVTITVNSVNDVPVANTDNYSVNEDAVLTVSGLGVLANDADADGDVLSASVATLPAHGALTLNANGGFVYTPTANFFGLDSFTYRASDGQTSSVATVRVTVNGLNDTPTVADESYSIVEDMLLIVSFTNGVLVNDFDADGDVLNAVLISSTTNGTLALNLNGSFTYVPNTNFSGVDHFTYRAADGASASALAVVTITVTGVNDAPSVQNDSYSVNEDSVLNIATPGVLGNDIDPDGDPLTLELVSEVSHGALTLIANGSFIYTPTADYFGADSFTYRINDGVLTSAVATVSINVISVNDPPIANNNSYSTDEDILLTVLAPGVGDNDFDPDSDPLTIFLESGVSHGVLSLSNDGSFTYLPNANFHGIDSFTYRASDGRTNAFATVSITVNSINDVPVAQNDSYSISEDSVLNVAAPGVLGNDFDADGDPLMAELISAPAHGALTLNLNGSFLYTPNADYVGADSFTYRVNDGVTVSAVATVSITVNSVNDIPLAAGDSYSTDEDTSLAISAPGVLGNDTDPDGDALSAVLVSGPAHGSLTLNANGSFAYTPNQNFNGADSFTYRARDGAADSAVATVILTVNPVNDVPVLSAIGSKTLLQGDLLTFTALASDVDSPAQTLTFTLEGPWAGMTINSSSGLFTWATSLAHVPGNYPVTVRVTDNGSPSLSASETINIAISEYAPPAITISDVTIPGGTDGLLQAVFDVNLSEPSVRTVRVDYATVDLSGIAGVDYTATNGTLIFLPGVTNRTRSVTVKGSSTIYTNRSFMMHLSNATNAFLADADGLAVIDSEPAPGLYIDNVTVVEGNPGQKINAAFTVKLIGPNTLPVSVSYAAVKDSALSGKDFKPKKGKLKFAPGISSQTILVPITGDLLNESNEQFRVNLSLPVNAVIVVGQGIGTISDNDPLPSISVADISTVEANSGVRAVSFTVRLSAKSGQAVSVDFNTADGTAVADSDYFPVSTRVLFPPGSILQKVIVGETGNTISEGDETFFVNLSNPIHATVGRAQAIATIRDNDADPLVSVSDATVVIDGSGANAVFTLQLSAPSEKPITVTYSTVPNSAITDVDYVPVINGSVSFSAGQTGRSVSVALLNNPGATSGRSFSLSLQIAENAKLGDRVGVCNIPAP